ncbi:MAG: lytic murein transglycosylase, partial [Pseudooceanicola sp.]|nr:lytic murein transglycosylase [Pseudooceanicola sp.]
MRLWMKAGLVVLAYGIVHAETKEVSPLAVRESLRPPERPEGVQVDEQGFAAWLSGFRSRAGAEGISPATLDKALKGVTPDPEVIRRDRNQNEFTKTVWVYLDTAASADRIAAGKAALAKNAALLDRIEAQYGVDKEIVTAIWGLESAYGAVRGGDSTIRSLATLAHDPRRRDFFEGELLALLKAVDKGEARLGNLKGSWAGAMGHTQFMPSSYRDHAVDFDGDGRRDIWSDDPADALASTANY